MEKLEIYYKQPGEVLGEVCWIRVGQGVHEGVSYEMFVSVGAQAIIAGFDDGVGVKEGGE